jgi:hypothetical protein
MKMEKIKIFLLAIFVLTLVVACDDTTSTVEPDSESLPVEIQKIKDAIDAYPTQEVSQTEKEGLLYMREEEKLARDVYLYLYDKYQTRVFNNIANSESTHMAALKLLIEKYGFVDPVTDDAVGIFQNEELATLYNQLTKAGDVSLVEALKVGATIEDLDIRDLFEYEKDVDNDDIKYVYENLTRGSRNHMRAFYPQVISNGGTYSAQFITQELLEQIINSSKETGSW